MYMCVFVGGVCLWVMCNCKFVCLQGKGGEGENVLFMNGFLVVNIF